MNGHAGPPIVASRLLATCGSESMPLLSSLAMKNFADFLGTYHLSYALLLPHVLPALFTLQTPLALRDGISIKCRTGQIPP